jgi:hypothetical protein
MLTQDYDAKVVAQQRESVLAVVNVIYEFSYHWKVQ